MAGNCFQAQNLVAEIFPGGVSSLWERPLIKGVPCVLKHTAQRSELVADADVTLFR